MSTMLDGNNLDSDRPHPTQNSAWANSETALSSARYPNGFNADPIDLPESQIEPSIMAKYQANRRASLKESISDVSEKDRPIFKHELPEDIIPIFMETKRM